MTFKIGQVSDVLKTQGAQLVLPVAILHIAAFALGYWISKISFGESTSRTISIECGMQVNFFSMSLFLPIFLMIFTINTMIVYMKIFSSHILFPLPPPHKKKKKTKTNPWTKQGHSHLSVTFDNKVQMLRR